MKLSIVMMVKNEEKYLAQCLEALKPIRDAVESELIIVDTGSEDRTVEIARQYTDRVYFHPWNNDFADMRNKSIAYAKGEWLLILDGDEVFSETKGIITFLKSRESKKYNTGVIYIKNITSLDDEAAYITSYAMRLFRNNNFYYEGAIHEQPHFASPALELTAEIIHYGYLSTDSELMEYKFRRNAGILREQLEKNPDNVYYWFQLSQTYGMYKDYENALDAALKACQAVKRSGKDLAIPMYVYGQLALCYYWNKRYDEMEAVCREAMEIKNDYLDFYFLMGEAQKARSRDSEAIKYYREYVRLYTEGKYSRDLSMVNKTAGKYEEVCLTLCMLYQKQKANSEALKYAGRIKAEKLFCQALPYVIRAYLDEDKLARLKGFYLEKVAGKGDTVQEAFWTALESVQDGLKDEGKNIKLNELFCGEDCSYGLLCRIRLLGLQGQKELPAGLSAALQELDFSSLPVFYADIFYWFLKNKYELAELAGKLRLHQLQNYLGYLARKYQDFPVTAAEYLEAVPKAADFRAAKVNKELAKAVLLAAKGNGQRDRFALERYLQEGIDYLTQIYNPAVLAKGRDSDFMNDEDAFLFYLQQAQKYEETDKAEYVKHLRHALRVFPAMKKGIEMLLAEVKAEINEEHDDSRQLKQNDEFQLLKEQLKANIHILLEAGRIGEAKSIIDQYLEILPDDPELLQVKNDLLQRLA